MTSWYRRYTGTVSDPKLAEAALVAKCSKSVAIAVWDSILESAAEAQSHGVFFVTPRNIAANLGEPVDTVECLFQTFETIEMLDANSVVKWSKRQEPKL